MTIDRGMKQGEKLYLFLMKAITAPNQDAEYLYYANSEKKTLKRIKVDRMAEFEKESAYSELPKLTYEEKYEFLHTYMEQQSTENQEIIRKVLENYKKSSDFFIEHDLKKVNAPLAQGLSMSLGPFLTERFALLYGHLEIDLNWTVDFGSG